MLRSTDMYVANLLQFLPAHLFLPIKLALDSHHEASRLKL